MPWEIQLIQTYYEVCNYSARLSGYMLRQSNNYRPAFTDEEVLTIYLFCSMDSLQLHTKSEIYAYADRHLRSYFPLLPKYEAFVQRCNHLCVAFEHLSDLAYQTLSLPYLR